MTEKQEIFTLLDGKIKFIRSIYNPTSDAVWLAAFAPTKTKTVLDVGIGTGGVSLCLLNANPDAEITGIDISSEMLDICEKNFELNNKNVTLLNKDIFEWSTSNVYDLVVTNPPYFNGTPAHHNAHHNVDIINWIKHCVARVKPGGHFCVIGDALITDKIISVLQNRHFGDIQIFPLFSGRNNAERVLIRAKQGSKTGATIYQGLSMNEESILRSGLTIDTILAKINQPC